MSDPGSPLPNRLAKNFFDSPADFKDEKKKKEFFDAVDAGYEADEETD